ncbi:MAG TPA: Ycf66 family protein [Coleofasciculaceae cyanobacterium]
MVNFGGGIGSLLGIALVAAGIALYFLRTLRPALARDQDIALAVVAVGCGGILIFNGWRLDPITMFGQFMLASGAIWFAVEAIRLRGIATEQAKRNTPIVDDERPVSRVYRAELDDFAPLDNNRTVTRRIRGSKDSRAEDMDRYETESRRRPPTDRSSARPSLNSDDRPRRPRSSRPLPPEKSSDRSAWDDDYQEDRVSDWGESRSSSRPGVREDRVSNSRSPRRRPSSEPSRRRDADNADYVDYQPIDYPGDEPL